MRADWKDEDTEAGQGKASNEHLWEDNWDDDDTEDSFSIRKSFAFAFAKRADSNCCVELRAALTNGSGNAAGPQPMQL